MIESNRTIYFFKLKITIFNFKKVPIIGFFRILDMFIYITKANVVVILGCILFFHVRAIFLLILPIYVTQSTITTPAVTRSVSVAAVVTESAGVTPPILLEKELPVIAATKYIISAAPTNSLGLLANEKMNVYYSDN